MKRLGLVVNPVAGLGGRVGLKGSDGAEIQARARQLGALPRAPERAEEALQRLKGVDYPIHVLTSAGEMGENSARACGFAPQVVYRPASNQTNAQDTFQAAQTLRSLGVDLLLFAGGDGTARDIHRAVGDTLPVLGIPAGVKIVSAVYAVKPRAAGELAADFLSGKVTRLREAEVMDLDEEAYRQGIVAPGLFGYLKIPYREGSVQGGKVPSRGSEQASLEAIAQDVIDQMQDDRIYIIGPGTTTRPILQRLGLEKSLIGVDVVYRRNGLALDANESRLLELLQELPGTIVVTPIGGQGYVFGRGNQQLSPAVLHKVGKTNILIAATLDKLLALGGRPLLVDTGDAALDQELSGFVKVITGYQERMVYRVKG